jgi:hypothetical protein
LSIRGLKERRWRREGGKMSEDINKMIIILNHLRDNE